MHDNIILQRAVPSRTSEIPNVHPHLTIDPIPHSREERVIGALRDLDGRSDAVVALPALVEVVGLEVERGLGKPVSVGAVVHAVDDVEGVHARSVQVHSGCWVLTGVLGV